MCLSTLYISSLNTNSVTSNLGEESSCWHLGDDVEVLVDDPTILLVQLTSLVLRLKLVDVGELPLV